MYSKLEMKASLMRRGITGGQLAEHLGINTKTMYTKMGNGGFSLDELTDIGEYLKLTRDEFMSIFFPQYL